MCEGAAGMDKRDCSPVVRGCKCCITPRWYVSPYIPVCISSSAHLTPRSVLSGSTSCAGAGHSCHDCCGRTTRACCAGV
jgi:hypothetical protein